MDGSLAIIFLITSLTDMGLNDCRTGVCLAQDSATSRLSLQIAEMEFQEESISEEVYVGYDMDRRYGPFQPTFGASIASNGATWVGAGFKWTSADAIDSPFFIETSLMPGYYTHGDDGPNLGGNLHFRSAFGAGYEFNNGATLTVLYDHRSNGDTHKLNPGLETIAVRYAIALH
ncbi:acyloxyacyl hydrolase [Loktanella sp. D2R18]|uniref:acyloxyacyl hydrolase n=1 Tax=Rhodobacterales TaxID=204455 RepID=UPI000DE83688|nr:MULTISPECIES: acyloxyacyl hydrolase [Rhodobacterales]MDO6591593.1 acyloxyacyl hydrolase [Yoonia sp. 1_MG-2023]RBW43709.1 acyloxyacyl hydrolase [Loktanella sp. D2R18]